MEIELIVYFISFQSFFFVFIFEVQIKNQPKLYWCV